MIFSREDFLRIPELAINPLGDRIVHSFFTERSVLVFFILTFLDCKLYRTCDTFRIFIPLFVLKLKSLKLLAAR